MKIRTDFLTNSSSSSFILGFTSEDKIAEELVNGFPEYHMDKIGTVLKDVRAAERFSKDEVIEKIREEMRWEAEWEVRTEYWHKTHCSYHDAYNYVESTERISRVKEHLDEIINKAVSDMEGKTVFTEVEYSDHDNSDLEHEIMPEVHSTIIRFNHH